MFAFLLIISGFYLLDATAIVNHKWATYKWGGAELVASRYGQLKPVLIPDAAIDEEGLGAVQGTDAAVWATISNQHSAEETRERQNQNPKGEEEAQGGRWASDFAT